MRGVVCLALLLMASPVWAHPDEDWDRIRVVLNDWATSMVNGDVEQFRSTVADQSFPMPRFSQVFLRYATHSATENGVRVEPIVLYGDNGTSKNSIWLDLTETDDAWKISGFGFSEEFPPELMPKLLPEHTRTRLVRFSLRDADTGEPVHARVHISDEEGAYWPPRGHQKNIRVGWRQDVGGDVRIADKTYAYVGPEFIAELPDGELVIEARRGMEHEPAVVTFRAEDETVSVPIKRWVDMNAEGWYSGDTHVHFLGPHHALIELRAEGLNLINVLATKWGELITDVERFTGAPSSLSDPDGIVYFNEETRHSWLGHTILHGLTELVYPLTWGGPTEGVRGGYDFPPMAHQADRTHAQGGMVTWAHFPGPSGELAVDVALGKIDSVDLLTWGDPFAGPPEQSPVEWWYRFLNTGSRLPVTAGTDKMLNNQVSGSVRTYAHVGDTFSYDGWLDAVRAGRTFVTTGPLVSFSADGKPIGSTIELRRPGRVKLVATVRGPFDRYPIDVLEIVRGGEIIASKEYTQGGSALAVELDAQIETSTWVAARVRGSKPLPYQANIPAIAHTSPIYVTLGERPVWSDGDAGWLADRVDLAIEWARNQARFQQPQHREAMLELFGQALEVYRKPAN